MLRIITGPVGQALFHLSSFSPVDQRLLVPTTTMAEHVRNELARQGVVFRPDTVQTFSKFIDALIPDLPQVTPGALAVLTSRALARLKLDSYEQVRDYPGFRAVLVSQIEELTAAGVQASKLQGDFGRLYAEIESEVTSRNWFFRHERLNQAAARIPKQSTAFLFHGFFSFTAPELKLIEALQRQADITIHLPIWCGVEPALESLRTLGAEEQPFDTATASAPTKIHFAAPTLDQECVEIARRILATGREFREIGVIVRSQDPYVPALRTAFERFGIPARFYFGTLLRDDPTIRYLSALTEAMLTGWEHEATLKALRMDASPIEQSGLGDEFEVKVIKNLPNRGLDALKPHASRRFQTYFDQLAKATTVEQLMTWNASQPLNTNNLTHNIIPILRARPAALRAIADCIAELKTLTNTEEPHEFWRELKIIIDAATLRVPDHRRNVVHVIDAYEARQWNLPVVFVCGLLERQFPKHHSESPILSDETRRPLRLRTAADRNEEERFLFDLAATRATSELVLSYPRLNIKAEENLRSFFLNDIAQTEPVTPVRPRPVREKVTPSIAGIFEDDLRQQLRIIHESIRTTAIENFLQCPHLFFGRYTLKLQTLPLKPADRLDLMLQGSIAHATLERACRTGEDAETALDTVFREQCERKRVPDTYRTEAVRLELLRNVKGFVAHEYFPATTKSEYEKKIELEMDGVKISGRIDRIDIDPLGRALVIDYKHKAKNGIIKDVKGHDAGLLVQGGLYVLALRKEGYETAGMVYAGFRRDVSFGGWIIPQSFPHLGTPCTENEFREMTTRAHENTLIAISQILEGRIAPNPADKSKCAWCDYQATCRVEARTAQLTAIAP
jgi:ATP-dependent helicase/DNAse subunit B